MNAYACPAQAEKTQLARNESVQAGFGGGGAFQFLDARPQSITQRKLQDRADNSPRVKQLQAIANQLNADRPPPVQKKTNNTGLPDSLKSGIETLSGRSMDGVKVHYNSGRPNKVQAHAYAQGKDIHVASGHERHLPHEAWHVVQQMQGRVQPTTEATGVAINDDPALEREADQMGAKAVAQKSPDPDAELQGQVGSSASDVVQRAPNAGNAGDYDAGILEHALGAVASVGAEVQTTHARHNAASGPANPTNSNLIASGHREPGDCQDGGGVALTVAGCAPLRHAIQQTTLTTRITIAQADQIWDDTRVAATTPGTNPNAIADAARDAAPPLVAGTFFTDVLAAVPNHVPTVIRIRGGVIPGSDRQLTRIHIIHHKLSANANGNSHNIFWGNPNFNRHDIYAEEVVMINFLDGAGVSGQNFTLAGDYFLGAGHNEVVGHQNQWYTFSNSTIPAKTGGQIANGHPLHADLDAAFGVMGGVYQQVNTASVPRVGSYQMDVNYGQNRTGNMGGQLNIGLNTEYGRRVDPRWTGETRPNFGAVLTEAVNSISTSVTITQFHDTMFWLAANPGNAGPNSAVAISAATGWNTVTVGPEPVDDDETPRFVLDSIYIDASGNTVTSNDHFYDW